MPLYEYKCKTCGEVFEVLQKFSDEPLTLHDGSCGGPVERLLAAPALQFKGTGWYVTDYARGNSGGNGHSKASSSSEAKKDATEAASKSASDKK